MGTSYSDHTYSASNYLDHRPRYPQRLYETILDFHHYGDDNQSRLKAHTDLALDLGCGPGIATEKLVPYFGQVVGVDEAESMIEVAKKNVPQAQFHVGTATHLPAIESSTVDLLTVATAAHWFPADWWQEASRIVKPGGTVALWVYSEKMYLEPSHPKADEINKHITSFVDSIGHYTTGNESAASMYDILPLPTPELKFGPIKRMSWNRNGTEDDLFMSEVMTIGTLRKRMHTFSPIYRWRIANPTKADTDEDPIEKVLKEIKDIAGWNDLTKFNCGHPLTLLMMKKH